MKASTENSTDLDMFNNLRTSSEYQANEKVAGPEASFIQKCMHPPSAIPNFHGLPTNDTRSQVTAEYRGIRLNRSFKYAAGDIGSDPKNLASTSKIALLSPNSARTVAYQFIWDDDLNGWRQDVNNVYVNSSYDFNRWQYDARLYRPSYKSITTYLNATYFNNTGMVVGNQFNPAVLFAGTLLSFMYRFPQESLEFVNQNYKVLPKRKSDKSTLPASWAQDYDNRYRYSERDGTTYDRGSVQLLSLDPSTNIQVVNLGSNSAPSLAGNFPVPTPDQVLQNSERSAGYKAMEGTFSVQRQNTIAPKWLSATNIRQTNPEPPINVDGLYICYAYWLDALNIAHYVPFNELDSNNRVAFNLDTQWTSDMTWSWTVYEGLTLNQNALSTGVPYEILLIKFYLGLEIQPTNNSAWSGMTKLAPRPDLQAMQLLQEMNYTLKDVLPCKYNAGGLGDILKMAFSALTGGESDILTSAANVVGEIGGKIIKHFTSKKKEKGAKTPKLVKGVVKEEQKADAVVNNEIKAAAAPKKRVPKPRYQQPKGTPPNPSGTGRRSKKKNKGSHVNSANHSVLPYTGQVG